MRFALRNKTKLIKVFGEDYYKLLVDSLKAFSEKEEDLKNTYSVEGYKYEFIKIPNIKPGIEGYFQFAIVGRMYDVINVAYYNAI